jgi:hypothetical protein
MCVYTDAVFTATYLRVLVSQSLSHVLLPLLHNMFRSRKDHRQVCTL